VDFATCSSLSRKVLRKVLRLLPEIPSAARFRDNFATQLKD